MKYYKQIYFILLITIIIIMTICSELLDNTTRQTQSEQTMQTYSNIDLLLHTNENIITSLTLVTWCGHCSS